MADKGLSEAEERYIFNEVGENELMVARINDVIKTAKLQTLGDVEKALPTVNNLKNLLKYGVKSDISEHDFNVFTVAEKIDSKYKDIIKNLREAL